MANHSIVGYKLSKHTVYKERPFNVYNDSLNPRTNLYWDKLFQLGKMRRGKGSDIASFGCSQKKILVELHQAVKLNNLEKVEKLLADTPKSEHTTTGSELVINRK